jgi:hemolysin activation/secretion protein
VLQVSENPIGRLSIRGSKFTSPHLLRKQAKSLTAGKLLNFDQFTKDNIAMNQARGRKVTPAINPGIEPGTFDVILNVEDEMPLHGSFELNNRYSKDTSPLRINAAISYENLWQLDHSAGLNFQIAPERTDDARVFSAYYSARLGGPDGWLWTLSGTNQDSDISTLGGVAVVGRGEVVGLRAMKKLPQNDNLYHTFSVGMDYKNFKTDQITKKVVGKTPITYYPLTAQYSAYYKKGSNKVDVNFAAIMNFRGMGSDSEEFNNKRFNSNGSFIYLRGDVSHTRDFKSYMQLFSKIQGQVSGQALINSEQFSAGGIGSVRGYLESASLGDDAILGTLELRTPSLLSKNASKTDDWRAYVFAEGGVTSIQDALPGQIDNEKLMSLGIGSRGRFFDSVNGSLDVGFPLTKLSNGYDRKALCSFRFWYDF